MKKTRTALSLFICACMLGATPGLHSYQAAAAVVGTRVQAVPANAGIGAVGAGMTGVGGIVAAPGLSLQGASLSGMVSPNSPIPQLKSQVVSAPVVPQAAAPQTVGSPIIISQAVIPVAKAQAGVVTAAQPEAQQSEGGIVRSALVQLQQMVLSFTKKGSRGSRSMPDYDGGSSDNMPDPDGSGSGIDPLGNPSRDPNRDTGPDSRDSGDSWDGGDSRGGSVLFKKGSRSMPDYGRDSSDNMPDPDGSGSGIDPLGNPSRDPYRDTGPDSRDSGDSWDNGGDSRGGSELFKGLSFAKSSKGSRNMPDYGRDSSDNMPDPDGSGSGIDPLGNPSRDPNRDTGPDSRDSGDSWDGGGDSRGNSELFKSPVAGLGVGLRLFAAPAAPADTKAAPVSLANGPVDIVVMFGQSAKPLAADDHLGLVDINRVNAVALYAQAQNRMIAQIAGAGLEADTMAAYNATPIATYARINAATIRVDAVHAAQFRRLLEARGFQVYDNTRRHIVEPVPTQPEDMDPSGRGSVSLDENLKITKADAVQALAAKAWGAPVLGFFGRLFLKLFGVVIPQPLVGVIDTGVDTNHPMLKGVRAVNATSGPNVDDNGHGSWVTSMILNYARWLKNLTHYKVFTAEGGATLDDILKALTMAGNDGNLVISNSWGSDDGDPQSPDSQLVRKLAAEGHVMVFAAGNAGPRANTVGSPAIVTYKDAKTGAIRVVSVAATDRAKKTAYFSSRGPGSPTTASDPNYKDQRPDLSAPGYNTDGAWPTDRPTEADRVDPVYGPLKAISGTSMATPAVAGAIALLAQVFGVTAMGEKLDAIVNGVMATLFKTGQSVNAEGQGFIDVEAAFKAISGVLTPVIPGFAARVVVKLAARSMARQERLRAQR